MKTLVCGGIAIDNIKLPNMTLCNVVGGSAVYASIASSLFSKTILAGIAGCDFPDTFLKKLEKRGIDTSFVEKNKKPSLRWEAIYSKDLSKITVTRQQMNAFEDFRSTSKLEEVFTKCKVVFLSNLDPTIQLEIIKKIPSGVIKMLDSMDLWIVEKREKLKKILPLVDIFLIDEKEASLFIEEDEPPLMIVDKIMSMGPKIVIFKKGEYGLSMYGKMGTISIPSYPLTHVVDPSGAGDALGGAIAGVITKLGRFDKESVTTALFIGSVIASFVVEGYTTERLYTLSLEEVANRSKIFLKQLPNYTNLLLDKIF